MNNTKWTKLFCCFVIIIICQVLTLKAQNKSNLSNLAETEWKASATFPTPPDTWVWSFNYFIQTDKKVRAEYFITVTGWRMQQKFDAGTGRFEWVNEFTTMPGPIQSELGIYEVKGNLIYLTFSNYKVKAEREDKIWLGIITLKSGEEAIWRAEKVTKDLKPSSLKETSTNIYGPWNNYQNLHLAILQYIVNFYAIKLKVTEKSIRQELEKLPFKEDSFCGDDYCSNQIAEKIAISLNEYFGKQLFKSKDFLPPKDSRSEAEKTIVPVMSLTISAYIDKIYIPAINRVLSQSK